MPTTSRHPKLSLEEIDEYYERIKVPISQQLHSIAGLSPRDAIAYLGLLQKRHLVSIPFENLALHYSRGRTISLHLDDVFVKIIRSKGRGGYCMELNALFAALLRSLGYRVRICGARTQDGEWFGGCSRNSVETGKIESNEIRTHMIILITIEGEKYVTDVGNGPKNMIVPLQLKTDGAAVAGIHPEEIRLIRTGIPDNEDPDEKVWAYQWRKDTESEWKDQFCFTELEFRREDFAIMNIYTSSSPHTIFTQRVICSKMFLDENEENISGLLVLSQSLRRSINGDTELVKEFKSEQDRLDALREYLGIEFSKSEAEAIKDTVTEITEPRAI